MEKRVVFLCLTFLFALSSLGQQKKIVSGEANGIAYTLPATAFVVDITVERTDSFRGPLANYAHSLLGIKNPIQQDGVDYRILGISIHTLAVSDAHTLSMVAYFGDRNSRDPLFSEVALYGNGTLAGINSSGNRSDVAGSYAFSVPVWDVEKPDYELSLAAPNEVTEVDTIVQLITYDTATIRDVSYKKRLVERSEEDKARDIVERILKLRQDRMNLLSGYQEVAYSEGTLQYMDQQFRSMERDYIALFRGHKMAQQRTFSFVVIPSSEEKNGKVSVCGFSARSGIDPSGSGASPVEMVFSTESDHVDAAGSAKGVTYRLPATAKVAVKWKDRLLGGGLFPVAQFGSLRKLPAVGGKPHIELDPESGAVLRSTIE